MTRATGFRSATLLKLLLVASMAGPALALGAVGAISYQDAFDEAESALLRQVDVLGEHSLRMFDGHRLVVERVRDLAEAASTGEEAHRVLKDLRGKLPQLSSIWVLDAEGRIWATSVTYPPPTEVNFSDRDYFQALRADPARDLYVSEIGRGRVDGRLFFSLAVPRRDAEGRFQGVIAVSADPGYFSTVFERLSGDRADISGLLREDGAYLARYPAEYSGAEPPFPRLPQDRGLLPAIERAPERGTYVHETTRDRVSRNFAYRKLEGLPVYVFSARTTAGIIAAWRRDMARYVPAWAAVTLVLTVASWLALRISAREERALEALKEASRRREAAEEALRRSQRLEAMGQLTGGVAHDFNNLLQVISGGLRLLSRPGADGRRDQVMEALHQAVRRGEGLTRHLLTFARRQALDPVVVEPREEIARIGELLRQVLRGKIQLVLDAPGAWRTRVDMGELELALLNLATNARDAMPEGGTLTIAVRDHRRIAGDDLGPAGDFVAVSVRDTGCGIPREMMEAVFEPFFTTKEHGKGTGLGLSQVYGFAKQSGGFVAIDSAPGKGTTVTLYLPRSKDRPVGVAAAAPPVAERVETPLRILFVEDNEENRATTAEVLRNQGHEVAEASDARAALATLEAEARFDLVFTDILMPGEMDGLGLAKEVRRRWPDLPVILATGYSGSAQPALEAGFPLLRKPYDYGDLSRMIAALARGPVLVPQSASTHPQR